MDFDSSPNQAFSYKPFPHGSSVLQPFRNSPCLAKCAATLLYLRMPMPLLTLCHLLMSFLSPACLSKGYYYSVFNCSSLSCHRPPCMLLLKQFSNVTVFLAALGIITEVFKTLVPKSLPAILIEQVGIFNSQVTVKQPKLRTTAFGVHGNLSLSLQTYILKKRV